MTPGFMLILAVATVMSIGNCTICSNVSGKGDTEEISEEDRYGLKEIQALMCRKAVAVNAVLIPSAVVSRGGKCYTF